MIPPFDENGNLPPGVHPATLDEFEARFGRESELRRVQFESLRWLIEIARRAGIVRLIVNGSFVTEVYEPNDMDSVLLMGEGNAADENAISELRAGLPFVEIDVVDQVDFDFLAEMFFATDRNLASKGMVELISWL